MAALDIDAIEARAARVPGRICEQDVPALIAEVRRLRTMQRAKVCGCAWCCSTVAPGKAGAAHLATCPAQKAGA